MQQGNHYSFHVPSLALDAQAFSHTWLSNPLTSKLMHSLSQPDKQKDLQQTQGQKHMGRNMWAETHMGRSPPGCPQAAPAK